MPPPPLSRRRLLALSASALVLPPALVGARASRAAVPATDRKFLYLFCTGGWDPTECLAPMLGTVVENSAGIYEATAGGIHYVTSADRAEVDSFFQAWADRLALVHGIEARSVAHDVCLRLMLTGTTLPNGDDWPSILAAESDHELLLPMVHISGPSYTGSLASEVVRVGANGQLADLLSGEALAASAQELSPLPEDALRLSDALVSARLESALAAAERGRAASLAEQALIADGRLDQLFDIATELDLAGGDDFVGQAAILAELFERGLARTGMVEFYGTMGLSWDTHAVHELQGQHFNTLLGGLSTILADLDSRTGSAGGSLLDETTVVVLSEMGRYPKINQRGGKEHWTYTSAMLLGAGVRGGTQVGGYDSDSFTGQRLDLETGEPREDGAALVPSHLGATLLSMAGVEPSGWVGEDYGPITAVMED